MDQQNIFQTSSKTSKNSPKIPSENTEKRTKKQDKMEKNSAHGWRDFWNRLDYGPRGSLIGGALAALILAGPTLLKLLLFILIIVLCTVLGGLIGSLTGWIIESYRSRKKKK